MDEIDHKIIEVLSKDARASFRAIGAEVGLSPNSVADRMRRMRNEGTIRGFGIDVSPEALGHGLLALIDVRFGGGIRADEFERRIAGLPGMLGYTLTTGRSDCTLRIAVQDQNELVETVEVLRAKFGALETYTRVILRERSFPGVRRLP